MSQATIRTISPATGELFYESPGVSAQEARTTVERAHDAFAIYRKTTLSQRKSIVDKALEIILSKKVELAKELMLQMGRPISLAETEFDIVRERGQHLVSIASEALADIFVREEDNNKRWVSKEAVGPVFIVSAWNFPWMITVNTLIPALLAGDSVILKPSPQTPLVADQLRNIFLEAGLPKDVLQVIHTGDFGIVKQVAANPKVKQICFTGSTAAGAALREAVAHRIVPMNLELGGNDPAYVRHDANVQWTASNVLNGAIFNSGQSCCAVERVYVHSSIYDDFVVALKRELCRIHVGYPSDPDVTIGPVVSRTAVQAIQSQIDDALSKGATDETPFNPTFVRLPARGSYIAPRLLTGVTHEMEVMKSETFGPLIPVMKVSDDIEAIRLINESDYGLTASIWTDDMERGQEIADQVDAGTVFVNNCNFLSPDLVWTGWKDSGLGSTLGPNAFEAFVKLKSHNQKTRPKTGDPKL